GMDSLNEGPGCRHRLVTQIFPEGYGVQTPRDQPAGEECPHFRGKQKKSIASVIVQRFDPQSVTCQKQPLLRSVPDGKRKHPTQTLQTGLSPLGVPFEDALCICPGSPPCLSSPYSLTLPI